MTSPAPLDAGYAALRRADWATARAAFTTALAEMASPEAHDGLGLALWWLNEIGAAHHQRTQAFLGYQQAGNLRRAAWLAAWLAREQVFFPFEYQVCATDAARNSACSELISTE